MYVEDNLIFISALPQVLFCERQYALHCIEQARGENLFTAEGEILHERVHAEHHESRRTFRQEYSTVVRSLEYGLIGKCDLVEIWFSKDKKIQKVSPVEFKRGREKEKDVDRVQLCAQALCLEEMLNIDIESGQIYYLQEHRRKNVELNTTLRQETISLIDRIREIQESEKIPLAQYGKRKCDNCSLVNECMPKSIGAGGKQVARYIQAQLASIDKIEKNNFDTDQSNK